VDGLHKRIADIAAELKGAGYDFDIEDVGHEFVITLRGGGGPAERLIHVMKMNPFPIEHNGVVEHYPIEDVIRAIIINPDASRYDTIHSPDFKKRK